MKNINEQFVVFLKKYLSSNPDALIWVMGYVTLAHVIDDIVDNRIQDINESLFIVKTFEYAAIVYSNHFYIQNLHLLYPLVKTASNSYMDSLEYENSNIDWKRTLGDTLRSNANDVVLMCVEIVAGIDARRQASRELRELSYKTHHTLSGEPI